jgi:hypothetical protein
MMLESVMTNLARIPSYGDARAKAILGRAGGQVTPTLLDSLRKDDWIALGRYGARQPTVALREASVTRLRDALLATGLYELRYPGDPRDLMITLALHHFTARQLGQDPAALFRDIAGLLPAGALPDLLRQFGARDDITLRYFGWQLVDTPEGPDFAHA